MLEVELFPWQRWLLIHALELRTDGGFRFRNVVVLVARQNGKSTLSQVLALWSMCVLGVDLVIGTAQDLDTAEEVWQGAVDLIEETDEDDNPIRPELHALRDRVVMVNGKKSLELVNGSRYKVKAASRRAGRGLSGDLILLDELREHQTWNAWGAITKTTMARPDAQVWALSNAGDGSSVVLAYLRKMAHAAIGDPDGLSTDETAADLLAGQADADDLAVDADDSLGIFEWSAAPGLSVWDLDGWAQANPSLGHKISERSVASAAKTDPEPVFRTEVLCQWVETADDTGVFHGMWPTFADPGAPQSDRVAYAVASKSDREWCAIACAWRRPDGAIHVELADYRPSDGWVQDRLDEIRVRRPGQVIASTAAQGLVRGAHEPSASEQAKAHMAMDNLIRSGLIRHSDDGALNTAVSAAKWVPYGTDRLMFDRRGRWDISPLDAAALAVAAVATKPRPPTPVPVTASGRDDLTRTGF